MSAAVSLKSPTQHGWWWKSTALELLVQFSTTQLVGEHPISTNYLQIFIVYGWTLWMSQVSLTSWDSQVSIFLSSWISLVLFSSRQVCINSKGKKNRRKGFTSNLAMTVAHSHMHILKEGIQKFPKAYFITSIQEQIKYRLEISLGQSWWVVLRYLGNFSGCSAYCSYHTCSWEIYHGRESCPLSSFCWSWSQ